MEIVNIKIPVYRTPEGKHTCAINFNNAEVCPFYQVVRDDNDRLVTESCSWLRTKLDRDNNGTGYLIPVPCGGCPVAVALNGKN